MTIISKSKYLAFVQCKKLLWYNYNARDKIPPPDVNTQAIFDQGHAVGVLARELFPGGTEVSPGVLDPVKVDGWSRDAVGWRIPLYEAGFIHGRAFARADILMPVPGNRWDLLEVKSSTEVKDVNLYDLAFQWYTYAGAGIDLRKAYIVHIDRDYVKRGEIEPRKLFVKAELTSGVKPLVGTIEKEIAEALSIIRRKAVPDVPIGPHCSDPYECPLRDHCWGFLPRHNVMSLYRLGARGFPLVKKGILRIRDIPSDLHLTPTQAIQAEAVRTGDPRVNRAAIGKFVEQLEYPLYFLDFETFATAVPIFDDSRPYQQIPFQYSLEVQRRPGARTRRYAFLSDGRSDPRPEILARLIDELGEEGSIVAYNASFEKNRIADVVAALPSCREWWEKTEPRFVDLLGPFRNFHYYHPDQDGSASIKSVLPVLTGKGYEGMGISDGGMASLEYLRVTRTPVGDAERKRVFKHLEEYCGRDTGGMVEIVEKLRSMV